MKKKILVLGGTGAMGIYLIPELLTMGYSVDVLTLDDAISNHPDLTYQKANAKDPAVISEQLKKGYHGVVDFMIYHNNEEFETFLPLYLQNTDHYLFFSTYRVYANEEHPVKETSPRILDVTNDLDLLNSNDYCIYKAQGEDFLKSCNSSNWTILRPAITYSKYRFQLVTLECDLVVRRMLEGKPVVLPAQALDVQATMSWAGDVAKMIARILLNKQAFGQTYSVCTAEHHTWGEIAEMYRRIGGLNYVAADTDTYLNILGPNNLNVRQQLLYDRCYDRIMDNSKILQLTGMKQSELMPLEKGLALELNAFPKDFRWNPSPRGMERYQRMDDYFNK